jgi:hypothetical protein
MGKYFNGLAVMLLLGLAAIMIGAESPESTPGPIADTSPNKSVSAQPGPKPTDGLREYTDTYKIQQPYDLKVSDRFLDDKEKGEYVCWVNKTDKPLKPGSGTGGRTEMRWNKNWSGTEHMWEADVFVEPGTDRTCVMQIKSNTGGEPIYLQVQDNNLYNDNNLKVVLLKDALGKWFHVVAAYNPANGDGRVWINGELKITRNYKKPLDTVWYFKNGVYNSTKFSKSHFKNIKFWEADEKKSADDANKGGLLSPI